ncbi:predicted protein [Chaetomium globosum CBS 148.51]|uniref:Uncharacterized protein n=1 Tax=Chaetomium globosum (strain ATCC 6205 / CBS 148.51 / DSM 1962 / NBRC 6347 / NRRL 1970) TaxID=306901 RepID=Q2H1D4_CHAGB|nr:uncharacterized protein CHGG_04412 [Chaetomium globosum CBS 148.51]EAQ87793.1 predicted protein [Chaetomium globosum CBS 148.51]
MDPSTMEPSTVDPSGGPLLGVSVSDLETTATSVVRALKTSYPNVRIAVIGGLARIHYCAAGVSRTMWTSLSTILRTIRDSSSAPVPPTPALCLKRPPLPPHHSTSPQSRRLPYGVGLTPFERCVRLAKGLGSSSGLVCRENHKQVGRQTGGQTDRQTDKQEDSDAGDAGNEEGRESVEERRRGSW